jgi:hypothetical protein
MVVDQDDPSSVQLASPTADPISLDVAPASVWGGSPSGEQVLLAGANTAEFRSVGDRGLGSAGTVVAIPGTLGQGAWSPDGTMIAAALIGDVKGGIPKTELVTVATEDRPGGRVQTVSRSSGAAGQVVWSGDGDSLVYVRSAGPRDLDLEAVRCSRPPDGPCESLFSWRRGVALLHLY